MNASLRVAADLGQITADILWRESRAALTRRRRPPGAAPRTDFDPFSDAVLADPYPAYRALHRSAPVHYAPDLDLWVVSGFEEVRAAAAAHDELSSAESIIRARHRLAMLVTRDRPDHARMRPVLARDFTRNAVAGMRPRIEDYAGAGLDRLAGGGDAVRALAIPLPVRVIADMLGVPSEDFERFRGWSDDIVTGFALDSWGQVRRMGRLVMALVALRAFVDRELARRRAAPAEDLLTALADAVDAGTISSDEAFWYAVLLLVAGNETTTNLLGTLLLALATQPEQLALLRSDPELIGPAIEEALRWVAPIQGFYRSALVSRGPIPAGARVLLLFGAANRDPARFPDPDAYDLTRRQTGHLAFGHGIHFCLGAHLARLEARIVLEHLLERGAEPRLLGPVRWSRNPSLRGPAALPLAV